MRHPRKANGGQTTRTYSRDRRGGARWERVTVIRLGVDVGGTFTDVVTLDEQSGSASWLKVLTDERSPSEGVLAAVRASGVSLPDVAHVRLGTTLAVNAVLTRSGARTGLITTYGFRDVLEIRRTHRSGLFDLDERIPQPLVPRDLRLEVRERVDAAGQVVTPLDEEGVRASWRALRAAGVSSLAIVFLFSFENPAHERRAREIVLDEGGAELVLISSDVLPLQREYERTSTTVLASYVAPGLRRHLGELEGRLGERGLKDGRLSVMTSSGGVSSPHALARNPVPSLLSGPAAGVAAALGLAREVGVRDLVTLDMGGTSCDVSGVIGGVADERLLVDLGGLAVAHPALDINTIGAGGGSIAWIDSGGALRVGPHSAGSHPGPACYGLGGSEPTVTDANLVLGRYDAEIPLGGVLRLDPALAREAIERQIAEPLEMSVEQAAAGIVRIAVALMAGAVRAISIERGRDPRNFALVAFGGAGPVHGAEVARELGVPRILIPPCPGCTSALGAANAGYRFDFMRTLARRVPDLNAETFAHAARELEQQARAALEQEGFAREQSVIELWLDLRYEGQAHELAIRCADADALAAAVAEFHVLHERLYGHSFADVPVELVNVRASAHGSTPLPPIRWQWVQTAAADGLEPIIAGAAEPAARERAGRGSSGRGSSGSHKHTRRVYFEQLDDYVETIVLSREQLTPGELLEGPAVVHQVDSTTLIPPGMRAQTHPTGSLMLSWT